MSGFVQYLFAGIGVLVLGFAGAIVSGIYVLPVGKIAVLDFQTLTLTTKPNQYLVCPANYCRALVQDPSPVYNMTTDELRLRWQHHMTEMPSLHQVSAETDDWQFTYLERSRWMGFPDLITIRFIPVNDSKSTLAIYSRSIYGHSDFGVNRARIARWLETFED